jgi:probable aminopeptidase NPEPL1
VFHHSINLAYSDYQRAMATISYSYTHQNTSIDLLASADVLIIAGSVDILKNISPAHIAFQQLNLASDIAIETLKSAVDTLSPSTDDESATSLLLLPRRKVTVAVLPTGASRHNTPSRSHAVTSIVKAHKSSDNMVVLLLPSSRDHALAQAIAIARPFPLFTMKSKKPKNTEVHVLIHLPEPNPMLDDDLLADIKATAESIRLCQRLVDTPPNVLTTDAYVEEAAAIAASIGCKIEVIRGKELDYRGFGGIAGVGRASDHPPAIVVLSHIPTGTEDSQSICIVGKGIVYDTGGLSIKVPPGMAGMKNDM